MSVANLLQTLGIQNVPPVPPANSCEGTENTHEKQPRTPCPPCTPEKHRGAEEKPKRANPDAVLLKVARQLQASPASLRVMMDDDDTEATATGEYTPAYLLEFFTLKQERGELLADQPQPLAPAPATRAPENGTKHAQRLKAWKPAHERFIDHLTACPDCYAPGGRYCTNGAGLRRIYLQSYQDANQPEQSPCPGSG
tara:strand:- start:5164 stop:5754 length:591 start_codon:yes stop_codon:yes gene_type:complete